MLWANMGITVYYLDGAFRYKLHYNVVSCPLQVFAGPAWWNFLSKQALSSWRGCLALRQRARPCLEHFLLWGNLAKRQSNYQRKTNCDLQKTIRGAAMSTRAKVDAHRCYPQPLNFP